MKYLYLVAIVMSLYSSATHTWGDEDYRYKWPSTKGINAKDGRSFANEPVYTYKYMPDTQYLQDFVDPDIDYPSQGTGNAYNY